ncbi:MAG: acetolactate synthase small subunit [Betaproteobacteria bacterium]|nr:acetolactate synthase small subunit [Betaproteobacteria bacterium]
MRHIISILLENEPGALSRVVGLFSARGYNIEALTVAPTEDQSLSRMTIATSGSDDVIEQITKQLNRLIDVVKVVDLTESAHIERELMLIKVRAVGKEREEMKRMADIFRGRVIDVTEKTYTIEVTGDGRKLDAFIEAIERSAIIETVRTGTSGIARGGVVSLFLVAAIAEIMAGAPHADGAARGGNIALAHGNGVVGGAIVGNQGMELVVGVFPALGGNL